MNSNDIVKFELKHIWNQGENEEGTYEVVDLEFNPFIDEFYSDKHKPMYYGIKASLGSVSIQLYDGHVESGRPIVLKEGAYLNQWDLKMLEEFLSKNQEEIKKFAKKQLDNYLIECEEEEVWVKKKNISLCF